MDHGLCPDEGYGAGVVAADEGIDVIPELSNVGEAGTGQRGALELAMPEVEVDLDTGHVTVTRLISVNDVGKAVNPQQVEGQIEGAVAQSVCWSTLWWRTWRTVKGLWKRPRASALKLVAAGLTRMPLWVPVMLGVTVSVAVIVRVPAVFRATLKTWMPLSVAVKV